MAILGPFLERLLARPVANLVRQAMAENERASPRTPPDPLQEPLFHGDRSRLHVHPTAVVNNALFNLASGDVTIGEHAFFGHGVSILTGSHDVEKLGRARQEAIPREGHDVVVGEGAWVASHAIVVGPCVIGPHAVVGVGSLVLDDVEPFTVVVGVPARPVRSIQARPG